MRHLMVCMALSTLFLACDQTKKSPPEVVKVTETAKPAKPEAAKPPKTEEAKRPDTQGKIDAPMLWKIDAGKGPVYLLGTVHLGIDAKKQFPAGIWDHFKASQRFVMEVDLGASQAGMAAHMVLPNGGTLEALLGKDDWALLDKRLGGAAATFRSAQPWFAISMLIMKMFKPEQIGVAMDKYLHDQATLQKKKMGFLETPEFQVQTLKKTLTIKELREMLHEYDKQVAELDELLTAYVKGDVAALEELSFRELNEPGEKERFEILFFKRNEAWIPKIKKYTEEEGNVFIAVGAGHLVGPRGVLALLEKEGLKAERVSFTK